MTGPVPTQCKQRTVPSLHASVGYTHYLSFGVFKVGWCGYYCNRRIFTKTGFFVN